MVTLGELRGRMLLRVQCLNPKCRRLVFFRGKDVANFFGEEKRLDELRFVCSQCRRRMVRLSAARPEEAGLPSGELKAVVEIPGRGR